MQASDKLSSRFKKIKDNSKKISKLLSNRTIVPVEVMEFEDNSLERIREEFYNKINNNFVWFEYTNEKRFELIRNYIYKKIQDDSKQADVLIDELKKDACGFGSIQYLLDKDNVSSVIVNSNNTVHIEINGKILNTDINLTKLQQKYIENYVKYLSGANNFVGINTYITDEYSITVIGKDICTSGLNISIKKKVDCTSSSLMEKGVFDESVYRLLKAIVSGNKSIIISGGANSGKTALLNVILNEIIDKRAYLVEKSNQIICDSKEITKFNTSKDNFQKLMSYISQNPPEIFVSDLNVIEAEIAQMPIKISTIRASKVEDVLKQLFSVYINDGLTEKFARIRALSDFDYIVHMNKGGNGIGKVQTIVELTPAKTINASLKYIVKDQS